jgi:diadenylate cyclase
MPQLIESLLGQIRPTTVLDVAITAILIYWLFSLIRGTRAVRLVVGVTVLLLIYFAAQALNLRLLTQILQTGAVVGLFALVVIFQPELRRALDRIGRVGSLSWLWSPADEREVEMISGQVARAAAALSREGHGALIVLERETGLEEIAETGVMIHGDLSAELLTTIFARGTALHDGAVIVRGTHILAAGALLPLAETTIHTERLGTRHRAALGITEDSDALVVVVSEENGQISLVERARIVRNLAEAELARGIQALLRPVERRGPLASRATAQLFGARGARALGLGGRARARATGTMPRARESTSGDAEPGRPEGRDEEAAVASQAGR